jgi:hypothetical protein
MKPIDALGISIRKKLSNLSHKLNTPFENISTEFLLERLVMRLTSNSDLFNKLIFKGGYVGLRIYDSGRYTVDLDALLSKGNLKNIVEKVKDVVCSEFEDGVWFRFVKMQDLITQGEYGGIRLIFRSGIGAPIKDINRAQLLHFDIGCGDPITPAPLDAATKLLIEQGELSWKVYPVETIVAEKLHALIKRQSASSRSKDIFDLSNFLPKCDSKILRKALEITFNHRGDTVPDNFSLVIKSIDTLLLKTGWNKAVSSTQTKLDFDVIFGSLIDSCEEIIDNS